MILQMLKEFLAGLTLVALLTLPICGWGQTGAEASPEEPASQAREEVTTEKVNR
jgi:hypothetical protein